MTSEEFYNLWSDTDLRQFVIAEARAHTRNPELQEDYIQEAWLWIGLAPHQYETSNLREIAIRAIASARWQEDKQYFTQDDLREIEEARQCRLAIMMLNCWR